MAIKFGAEFNNRSGRTISFLKWADLERKNLIYDDVDVFDFFKRQPKHLLFLLSELVDGDNQMGLAFINATRFRGCLALVRWVTSSFYGGRFGASTTS